MPVEAAEEHHRPLEVLDAEGRAGGGGRRGVDEICPLERLAGDLDVNELLRAERLDEQDVSAQARAVPAGGLANILGSDPDGDLAPDVALEVRALGDEVRR